MPAIREISEFAKKGLRFGTGILDLRPPVEGVRRPLASHLLNSVLFEMLRAEPAIRATSRSNQSTCRTDECSFAVSLTTGTATATSFDGATRVEITGMKLEGANYLQLVAGLTNHDKEVVAPGQPVTVALSGTLTAPWSYPERRFERLPGVPAMDP